MKRLLSFLPLMLVLMVLSALGWQLATEKNQTEQGAKSLPVISLPSAMRPGSTLKNGDLSAKVNVLNIFASWCTPCLAELPMLKEISGYKDVKVYGIAWHDKDKTLQAWIKEHSPPFADMGSDMDGRVAIALGIRGVPESFFLDRDGNILYHKIGVITRDDMEEEILPLIRKHTGAL